MSTKIQICKKDLTTEPSLILRMLVRGNDYLSIKLFQFLLSVFSNGKLEICFMTMWISHIRID